MIRNKFMKFAPKEKSTEKNRQQLEKLNVPVYEGPAPTKFNAFSGLADDVKLKAAARYGSDYQGSSGRKQDADKVYQHQHNQIYGSNAFGRSDPSAGSSNPYAVAQPAGNPYSSQRGGGSGGNPYASSGNPYANDRNSGFNSQQQPRPQNSPPSAASGNPYGSERRGSDGFGADTSSRPLPSSASAYGDRESIAPNPYEDRGEGAGGAGYLGSGYQGGAAGIDSHAGEGFGQPLSRVATSQSQYNARNELFGNVASKNNPYARAGSGMAGAASDAQSTVDLNDAASVYDGPRDSQPRYRGATLEQPQSLRGTGPVERIDELDELNEASIDDRQTLAGDRMSLAGDRMSLAGDRRSLAGDRMSLAGDRQSLAGNDAYDDDDDLNAPPSIYEGRTRGGSSALGGRESGFGRIAEEDEGEDDLNEAPGDYYADGAMGGGETYGQYGQYQRRELVDSEDEELEEVKNELRFVKKETVQSSRNALRLASEAETSGRNTLGMLGWQGEKLANTEANLALTDRQTKIARENANELKRLNRSIFLPNMANRFNSRKRHEAKEAQLKSEQAQAQAARSQDQEIQRRSEQRITDGLNAAYGGDSYSENAAFRVRQDMARENTERKKYQFEADSEDEAMENEIDDNLDALHDASKRLHNLALQAGDEVDDQNRRIERLARNVDRVDVEIHMNTTRMATIR